MLFFFNSNFKVFPRPFNRAGRRVENRVVSCLWLQTGRNIWWITALITDSQTLPRCEVTSGLIDVMESAGVLINHKSVTERSEGSLSVFTSAVRQEHEVNSMISMIYTSLIIFVHFVEYCHVWLTADFRSDHMSDINLTESKPHTAPLHLYTWCCQHYMKCTESANFLACVILLLFSKPWFWLLMHQLKFSVGVIQWSLKWQG